MTVLLATADWHVGAGGAYPGRLDDQARVADRIADIAIDRGVAGVLHAGDVLDGPTVLPEHLAVFAGFLRKLEQHDIPVLVALGNGRHDQSLRETNGLAIFDHFGNCTVAAIHGVHDFGGANVACLPWVHAGRLIARAGRDVPRDEINLIAADLLVDAARDLYAECATDRPSILMLHWSISGASLPTGLPVDQLREPVIPADALDEIGYDAIVAGHIHARQRVGSNGFYCAPPMPLSFGEQAGEHGVTLLDLGASTTEFVPVDSPRFVTLDYAHDGPVNVVTTDFDLRDAIVRYRYTATAEEQRGIDVAAIRAELLAAGARVVTVEPTIIREQRARAAGVDEQLDELAALELWIEATAYSGDGDALRDRARDLLEAVA